MRKVIIAYVLAMIVGLCMYLTLSESNLRLMSLDSSLISLEASLKDQVYPNFIKEAEFTDEQLKNEFQAICTGVSLGCLIWLVLFILHRIQIFVVDFSAFMPLKK